MIQIRSQTQIIVLLISCVAFTLFVAHVSNSGTSSGQGAVDIDTAALSSMLTEKLHGSQSKARPFISTAAEYTPQIEKSPGQIISVNGEPACNLIRPPGASRNYSAWTNSSLQLWANSILTIANFSQPSLPLYVNGELNVDTNSKVVLSLNATNGWSTNYNPQVVVFLEAQSCPSTVIAIEIKNCPKTFSCSSSVTSTTAGCKLSLILTPTQYLLSKAYYTLQLNMDCATYTPAWFQATVAANYSAVVAKMLVLDPLFCGSVYQSFRCASYSQTYAENNCSSFYSAATVYNTSLFWVLGVNWGWKLLQPFRPEQSNYALHALFCIFALPVFGVLSYGCYKESQKRQKEASGAYTEDDDDDSVPAVARPVGK